MQGFGLPENYASLTPAQKLRELASLDESESDAAVVERFEQVLIENRRWQAIVLDTTRGLRTHLESFGYDELTAPKKA